MGYKEEKQHQLDMRYLRMARIWAENSYCVRRKVGALIVKDKMIISDGYNGTPAGFENICEDETGKTAPKRDSTCCAGSASNAYRSNSKHRSESLRKKERNNHCAPFS